MNINIIKTVMEKEEKYLDFAKTYKEKIDSKDKMEVHLRCLDDKIEEVERIKIKYVNDETALFEIEESLCRMYNVYRLTKSYYSLL